MVNFQNLSYFWCQTDDENLGVNSPPPKPQGQESERFPYHRGQSSPLRIRSDPTMASQISLGAKNSSSLLCHRCAVFFKNILPVLQLRLTRSWVFEELGIEGITELIKLNDLLWSQSHPDTLSQTHTACVLMTILWDGGTVLRVWPKLIVVCCIAPDSWHEICR